MEDRNVKRGDIYHADLDPVFGSEQGGYRPVLVIQNNIGNKYSPTVIVAAITSKEKMKLPTHIAVPEMEELEKDSVVLLEQLRTLDKRRLENYVCTLDRTEMEKINKAIRRSTCLLYTSHFLMDEFANVSLPDDFDKILSVMRSREVSVSIILQNLAQLKALFEKQWESIMGNCDEFLYLGGNEQGTHKYVSELLGKATIDTNTYGKSTGHSGNYSSNYQNTGRELMTPDEVRMLDNRYAILFIRGERPILDEKFDILKHPNVGLTTDGNGKPYLHGAVDRAVASISLGDSLEGEFTDDSLEVEDYELLSDEDLEEIIQKYQ